MISPSRFWFDRLREFESQVIPFTNPSFGTRLRNSIEWTEQVRSNHDLSTDGTPPREGTPARILQTPSDIIFFYTTSDYGGGNMEFRDVAIGGPAPRATVEAYYMGLSTGKWEGDTLVIDSTNFVDTTWFGRGGLLHSADMHMVEKFTRKGDEILYQVTIDDPDLIEPWVMPDRILRATAGAPRVIHERAACEVYEEGNVSTQLRH